MPLPAWLTPRLGLPGPEPGLVRPSLPPTAASGLASLRLAIAAAAGSGRAAAPGGTDRHAEPGPRAGRGVPPNSRWPGGPGGEPPYNDRDPYPDADGQVPGASGEVARLVARVQAGDSEAYGQLFDRYGSVVHRYIYYRVGSTPLAEDLTSETFLRGLRWISTFSWQGKDFVAWLIAIARRQVAEHYRSKAYRLEVTTADMLQLDRPSDGPESAVVTAQIHETLVQAVKLLKPEQQECLALRFFHGFSVAETALAMDKNDDAIKSLQYRALRTLAKRLPAEVRP
jgi:RNA polymerase sigma-70 factor (ECF subfamily)